MTFYCWPETDSLTALISDPVKFMGINDRIQMFTQKVEDNLIIRNIKNFNLVS